MEILNNKKSIIIVGAIVMFIIGGILILNYKKNNNINTNKIVNIEQNEEKMEEKTEENIQSKIYVHIVGEINNSGVIELNEGSRIIDVINAAGGVTENADLSKVNLAYILSDGSKITIPNKNDNLENFICVTFNPGEGVTENMQNVKVNINTATQSELETITGVGPSIAAKIIKYRENNGKYKTIEDLKNVGGIGEEKFNNMKEYIRIK